MKCLIMNLVLYIVGMSCFAQDTLQVGGYLSSEEYITNSPSLSNLFIITRRSASDIRWNGGNNFKVEYPQTAITREDTKYRIWAVNRGDSLFINGWRLGVGMWYTVALTRGRYICMEGGIPGSPQLQKELRKNGSYKPVGGIITFGKSILYNPIRFLYIYDTKNNMIDVLDEKSILKILEPEINLVKSFKAETEVNKETYLRYVELLNGKTN